MPGYLGRDLRRVPALARAGRPGEYDPPEAVFKETLHLQEQFIVVPDARLQGCLVLFPGLEKGGCHTKVICVQDTNLFLGA